MYLVSLYWYRVASGLYSGLSMSGATQMPLYAGFSISFCFHAPLNSGLGMTGGSQVPERGEGEGRDGRK